MTPPAADFILLPFFNRLRQSAGMALDMTQYHLFLELFMKGYAKDEAGLLLLCKTLWLSKLEYETTFTAWFWEAIAELKGHWLPEIASQDTTQSIGAQMAPVKPKVVDAPPTPKSTPQERGETQKTPALTSEKPDSETSDTEKPTLDLMEVVLNFEEGSGQSSARRTANEQPSEKDTVFLFSDEKHFPITPRRLGHALQKLRMNWHYRDNDALDVATLSQQLGKARFVTDLAYLKEGFSNQKVLLLTDHAGPMNAFEPWGDFLFRTLSESPAIRQVERYYFHRYPSAATHASDTETFKLFANANHTASFSLAKILAKAGDDTWFIVFSDGGIYPSDNNDEALQHWWRFLALVRPKISAITWFNPFPAHRWKGTAAEYLSFLVKMAPFNPEGLKQGIKWANHAHRNRLA